MGTLMGVFLPEIQKIFGVNPVYTFFMDSGGRRNTASFLNSLHLLLFCK